MTSQYWLKFPVTVTFLEPGFVEGTITALETLENVDGIHPRIRLRRPDGGTSIVNATQTRLVAELVRLSPAVGDKVRITYHGTAKKAARGFDPAKEFTVEIWPQNPQSQARPAAKTPGRASTADNDSATGEKPK